MSTIALLARLGLAAAVSAPPPAPDPGDFAIMPWGVTRNDPEVHAGICDCGFNLAGFVPVDAIDNVGKAGLKGMVASKYFDDDGYLRRDDKVRADVSKSKLPITVQLAKPAVSRPPAQGHCACGRSSSP